MKSQSSSQPTNPSPIGAEHEHADLFGRRYFCLFVKYLVVLALIFLTGSQSFARERKASAKHTKEQEKVAPKTLEEAHQQLEKLLRKADLAKIDAMKTEEEMSGYHLGLGMNLRNSWGLRKGGPLAKHMNSLGFHHPDDMSGVILKTFWCKRHNKDFRLKERADHYAAFWRATAVDPMDGSEIIWNMAFMAGDGENPRQIHVGKSKKTGRWLAYEYDKGVYEPDTALLKRITDSNTFDQSAPGGTPTTK